VLNDGGDGSCCQAATLPRKLSTSPRRLAATLATVSDASSSVCADVLSLLAAPATSLSMDAITLVPSAALPMLCEIYSRCPTVLLRPFGDHGFCGDQKTGNRRCILQGRPNNLGWINNAFGDEVAIGAFGHGKGDLAAHRTLAFQELQRNSKRRGLVFLRIGYETPRAGAPPRPALPRPFRRGAPPRPDVKGRDPMS